MLIVSCVGSDMGSTVGYDMVSDVASDIILVVGYDMVSDVGSGMVSTVGYDLCCQGVGSDLCCQGVGSDMVSAVGSDVNFQRCSHVNMYWKTDWQFGATQSMDWSKIGFQ